MMGSRASVTRAEYSASLATFAAAWARRALACRMTSLGKIVDCAEYPGPPRLDGSTGPWRPGALQLGGQVQLTVGAAAMAPCSSLLYCVTSRPATTPKNLALKPATTAWESRVASKVLRAMT